MNSLPEEVQRILVVDDNEMNRDLLARRLVQRGYAVDTASDGSSALELLEAASFDLVLLDVMMPGLSGLDVLRSLRRSLSPAELPVVMATAKDGTEDVVEAFEAGANDYVTKPLNFPVVLARLRTQLELRRSQRLLKAANERLEDARRRIERLETTASRAQEDPAAWGAAFAADLAGALGAREVGVFALRGEELVPLVPTSLAPPPLDILRRASKEGLATFETGVVAAVVGPTGTLHGGILVPLDEGSWDEGARGLLASFAHHMAGALELSGMRRELATARVRRETARRELLAAGVDLLLVCPCCGLCYDHRASHCAADGKVLEAPRFLPFRLGGRYRLVRSLGEGGMGSIYEGHDERLSRPVALKILKPEHFGERSVRVRFEQEAHALGRIAHPGVVTVHDFGELEDGSFFLVMEMLRGRDLEMLLRHAGPGNPRQVAEVVRLGGSALSGAHRAGVLHRDVKPGNVFLCDTPREYRVKVLDFGLAKSMRVPGGVTQSGLIVGTPAYMSPEQIQERDLDERSDLYSFAAVAWESLTGRRLVGSTELFDIFSEIVRKDAPLLSSVCPGLSPKLDLEFRRALLKDSARRPVTVEEWTGPVADLLDQEADRVRGWPEVLEEVRPLAEGQQTTAVFVPRPGPGK